MKTIITRLSLCLVLLLAMTTVARAADDILIADFEGPGYGEWEATGDAFGEEPARGTLQGQQQVTGFKGKGLVNTFRNRDASTGTLTSPAFPIQRKYITFLIGGGMHDDTCMQLLIDGEVVAVRSGQNEERLTPAFFDVADHMGKTARLRIVDQNTGGWGHVNVDQIVLSDTKPEFGPQERTFTVRQKYLVIPIKNGAKRCQLSLQVDGEEVRRYDTELATDPDDVDWWAFFTIEDYKDRAAEVSANPATKEGFALVCQADKVPGSEGWYTESMRPQLRFSQKVGWNNDPNGMVWHDGRWHLFFQHNPVGVRWGNMTWGHATSTDLVHWEQQPNKLFPKTMAVGDCFSGGATVDKHNTAGWGENTLVAFFTDTGCGESIAYSTDGGDTFTYYEGNPVVKHNGRDPKVIWYAYDAEDQPLNDKAKELGGHWVMAVYDEHQGRNTAFYTSTNLKEWALQSHLPGFFECPELFELPVDGAADNTRWVTCAADGKYVIGSFDGRTFKPAHQGKHTVFYGNYYAAQTFDNAPDGRRIQIGWARMNFPGMPFNQTFSFPHRLTLRNTGDGIRMFAEPVKEIARLHSKTREAKNKTIAPDKPFEIDASGELFHIRATFTVGSANKVGLDIGGERIVYDTMANKLDQADLKPVDGKVTIEAIVDRPLLEIIGNDGRVFITRPRGHKGEVDAIQAFAEGGEAKLIDLKIHELKSIWKKPGHHGTETIHPLGKATKNEKFTTSGIDGIDGIDKALVAGSAGAGTDKTLVSWATITDPDVRAGSILTIQQGGLYDGIVFAEIAPGKWMAGSDRFRRTNKDQQSRPAETADGETLVQMAIVYQDDRIAIYRNGELYGKHQARNIDLLAGDNIFNDTLVVFGLRFLGGAGSIAGSVDDARIFDKALTVDQIKSLKPNEESSVEPYAWWDFEGDKVADRMGRFPHSMLLSGAKIENGKLVLGEGAMLIAAAKKPVPRPHTTLGPYEPETPRWPDNPPKEYLHYHLAHPPGTGPGAPGDPNPMYYYKGRYHLHYIYNFFEGGGFAYAHVSSTDMVHWQWHPTVLVPKSTGHGMFSGTGFFTKDGRPAMIYHGWGSGRNHIMYALDDHLDKWSDPQVIEPKNKDGNIPAFRHWDPDCWQIGDTYYALSGGKDPELMKSEDLKDWLYLGKLLHEDYPSDLGIGRDEDISCANMFKIGNKWMLLCISHRLGCRYYLGDFKDEKYLPESHAMMSFGGNHFFAPESMLTADGRRVMWAWVLAKAGDLTAIQCLPRELELPEDGVLRIRPLRELEQLRHDEQRAENLTVKSGRTHQLDIAGDSIEIRIACDTSAADEFGLDVLCDENGENGMRIAVAPAGKMLSVGTAQAPFELKEGEDLVLRVFVDKTIVEVFANDRQAVFAHRPQYDPKRTGTRLFSSGGEVNVQSVTGWKMKSAYAGDTVFQGK